MISGLKPVRLMHGRGARGREVLLFGILLLVGQVSEIGPAAAQLAGCEAAWQVVGLVTVALVATVLYQWVLVESERVLAKQRGCRSRLAPASMRSRLGRPGRPSAGQLLELS